MIYQQMSELSGNFQCSSSTRKFLAAIARQRRESEERSLGPGTETNPFVLDDDEVEGVAAGEPPVDRAASPGNTLILNSLASPSVSSSSVGSELPMLETNGAMADNSAEARFTDTFRPASRPHDTASFLHTPGTSSTASSRNVEASPKDILTVRASSEARSLPATGTVVPLEGGASPETRDLSTHKGKVLIPVVFEASQETDVVLRSTRPLRQLPTFTGIHLKPGHIQWNIHSSGHHYLVLQTDGTWQESRIGSTHPTTTKLKLQHLNPDKNAGSGPTWAPSTSVDAEQSNNTLDLADNGGMGPDACDTAPVTVHSSPIELGPADLGAQSPSPRTPVFCLRPKEITIPKSNSYRKQYRFTRTASCSSDPIQKPPEISTSSPKPGDIHWHSHSAGHQYWVRQRDETWAERAEGTPHPLIPARLLRHSSPNGFKGTGPTWVLSTSFKAQQNLKARRAREAGPS